jgi:hypothetical protein
MCPEASARRSVGREPHAREVAPSVGSSGVDADVIVRKLIQQVAVDRTPSFVLLTSVGRIERGGDYETPI